MKQIIILLFVVFIGQAAKGQVDSLWSEANKQYLNQNYTGALDIYLQLEEQNLESKSLYFNLGNTYYKLNNIPMSILYYERANLLDPNDEDVLFNLNLARTQTIDKIEVLPSVVFKNWYHRFVSGLSIDEWGVISLILFFLSLTMVVIYMFSGRMNIRRIGLFAGVAFFVFSFMSYLFAFSSKKLLLQNNEAIVTDPSVTVRGEPSDNGTELFVLHEGTKVTITDELGEWVEIKLSDGNNGWIEENDVIEIQQNE